MRISLLTILVLGLTWCCSRSVWPEILKAANTEAAHQQAPDRGIGPRQLNGRRIALVIGNGAYPTAPLPNPPNDAQELKKALDELGFDVTELIDKNKTQIKTALRDFGVKLEGGEGNVGLFFFAGHGVQVNGRNYLIPTGADVTNEAEAEDECVNVDLVLAQMQRSRNGLNILVLDACRNNPFRGWRSPEGGLASIKAPRGTLIAYATAPGRTASDGRGTHSPYTAALLAHIRSRGVSLLQMFERVRAEVERATNGVQTPWESTSVTNGSEFYLAGRNDPPPFDPRTVELTFWNSISNSRNASDYRAYLAKYPNGEFRALAENRLAELTAKPTPTPTPTPIITPPANNNPAPNVRTSVTGVPLRAFDYQTVSIDASGKVSPKRSRQAWRYTENINGVALEMVEIEEGTFTMGSPASEAEREKDEGPQHQVTVSGVAMGKYEVTQAQWAEVAKLPKVKLDLPAAPSRFKGAELPVEQVSWEEAVEFCARLGQQTGRTYRLPTEAEWEYAARARTTTTAFAFGETITPEVVNYDGNSPYGRTSKGQYRRTTVAVGSLGVANGFGLYDMHGNVYEWCADWYGGYPAGNQTDPSGPATGQYRVLRGGSWYSRGRLCRSANRYWFAPGVSSNYLGFRVVSSARTRP